MQPLARAVLLAALFHATTQVAALHLQVHGEPIPALHRRAHVSSLDNGSNIRYRTNITLNGTEFSALVDTGSSDTWIAGVVPGAKDTRAETTVNYAIGQAKGRVKTATLQFLGYTIYDQAFLETAASKDNPAGQGLVGLGPNAGSKVHNALQKKPEGDAVIDRIFRQNRTSSNFLSINLGRSDDPEDQWPGDITVGEILPGLDAISSQPQLPVTSLPSKLRSGQHWQVLMDSNGIIAPDGTPVPFKSHVSTTRNRSQATAIFDTGFSLPQVPKSIADNIYSRFVGASFQNVSLTGPVWTLPCDVEVNITPKLGGKAFPMHPLDANMDLGLTDDTGAKFCVGTLQPITTAASPNFDIILGMAFLRNAYLLINYGDFLDGANTTADPFVQLLSTTDPAEAHNDFVQVRLNGVDLTSSQRSQDPVLDPDNDDDDDDDDKSNSDEDYAQRHRTAIIVGAVSGGVGLALGLALLAWYFTQRRRSSQLQVAAGNPSMYLTLDAAAPAGDMTQVNGYAAGVQAPSFVHTRNTDESSVYPTYNSWDTTASAHSGSHERTPSTANVDRDNTEPLYTSPWEERR
ncbi:aspartic peptidase domain-containing protein [Amylostereum chailletii]|nr:aspartic peptidase domain-containing protein [Amylostereum chailletii]